MKKIKVAKNRTTKPIAGNLTINSKGQIVEEQWATDMYGNIISVPSTMSKKTKDQLNKISTDISNGFAYKAFVQSLPDDVEEGFYVNAYRKIDNDSRNYMMKPQTIQSLIITAMIEKYTYERIREENIIDDSEITKYVSANPLGVDYEKYPKMGYKLFKKYVETNLQRFDGEVEQLSVLMVFSAISKQKDDIINKIIKRTKEEEYSDFVSRFGRNKKAVLTKMYNLEDIKNKNLFKELKIALNEYIYESKARSYLGFRDEVKKEIKENSLEYHLKNLTIYKDVWGTDSPEGVKYSSKQLRVYNDLANLFGLEIITA